MSRTEHRNWLLSVLVLLAGLSLASCNFPTQTSEPSAEDIETTELEPAAVSSEVPPTSSTTTSPTIGPTEEPEAGPTPTAEQRLRAIYADEGNLWALEVGSSPRQLTVSGNISEVRISDDGQRIAYTIRDPDEDTAELFSIQFDGSEQQILLNRGSFNILYPLGDFTHYTLANLDFLPNSHVLLFNTRGVFEGPGLAKNDDLLSIDAASGQINLLLLPAEGGDFTPSASGSEIAIVRPDSLSFVNADGSNLRSEVMTFAPVLTYSEYFFYPLPVWSDGSVVLAIPQQDPFFATEPGTIWSVDGEVQDFARADGDLFGPQGELPIVSPDGSKVVFFRAAEGPGEQDLVILDLDSSEEAVYETGAIRWQGWSPDSRRFVYSKGSGLDLYLGELGTPPVSLGSGMGLRWVGTDEYLYFAGVPGTWTLTLGDLTGASTPLAMSSDDFPVFDFAE